MAGAPEMLDIEGTIAGFIDDAARQSMEFPHMSAAQRKHAKAVLEKYPDLTSESYGFGKERTLHLFKKPASREPARDMHDMQMGNVASAVNVKNTFIDDWANAEREPFILRSMPTYMPTSMVQCVMDDAVCKLELCCVTETASSPSCIKETECSTVRETDCSTVAPSSCASDVDDDDCCSKKSFGGSLPDWFRLPPGLELEVQNTFVHFKEESADERAVQSMPRSMFRKCLLLESLLAETEERVDKANPRLQEEGAMEDDPLVLGASVVIEGLSKCPAFNGLTGIVQSFDAKSGRYRILLSTPECSSKVAMLKRENCRLVPLHAGADVLLEGLSKSPAFNGLLGTVQSFDAQSGRYKVLLSSSEFQGKTAMLKRSNCRLVTLPAGTEVVIEGLSKYPAFNGLNGTIQSFEPQSGRYNILLASPVHGCKSSMVKRENFRLTSLNTTF